MYFNFPCEHCGKNLKVREENAGRKARCPYCHATLLVPESTTPSEQAPRIDTGRVSTSMASRKKTKPASTAKPSHKQVASDGTNVSMLWTALVGLGMTVGFYVLILPFYGTRFWNLLTAGTWVVPTESFLMFWAVAILIFKFRKLLRQRESMLFDALPESCGAEITLSTLDKFVNHVRELPAQAGDSFLIQRVLRGLEHFRVRQSASETATMLASQSEIDGAAAASSYAMPNVIVWAIPILGFIGTVLGLGTAVAELSESLGGAENVDQIKETLQEITKNLGTAFDTTLIALIMALLLKLPTSSLQKAEEDLLNSVDEYCNENLLRRLNDGRMGATEGGEPNAAIVGQLIEAVGVQMSQLVQQHQKATVDLSERTGGVQKQVVDSMRTSADSLQRYTGALEKGLGGLDKGIGALNRVLSQLGEKQVVIQMQPAPKKRWGWFGRSNGE
jgi:biopolymer transport protein ExbB/TolQ/DNA-directed RNA polymerase subunit RPC12/RpoP